MDLLFIYTAIRAALTDVRHLAVRHKPVVVAALVAAVVVVAILLFGGDLLGVLLVSAIAALISANAFWWWFHDREQQARIRNLDWRRHRASQDATYWQEQAYIAEKTVERMLARQDVDRAEIAATLAKRMGDQP